MPFRFLIGPRVTEGNLSQDADTPWSVGAEIRLSAERSSYLCKVLRKRRDDLVECFDGAGTLLSARVTEPSPKRACLEITLVHERAAPPNPRTHVVLGMLKGAAMDRAVQQATELGASDIYLAVTARSNVKLDEARLNNKIQHWTRVIQSACEQCGQLFLPTLSAGVALADLLETAPPTQSIALQAQTQALPRVLKPADWWLFIGPEGGWDEVELARFTQLEIAQHSIGPHTLRAETVPSVALALLYAAKSDTP